MPNELKIVIDADIQKGVAGIKEFSKVVSGEFNKAIGSVSSLEKSISASISKINSSLSGLKVTSLDVSVNTSQIDAGIKSIQSKFATLVDPKIDILANSTQAEATIKDLIADISALKGSEIFIRANDTQALKVLNEVEAELNDLVGKNISLNVTANLSKLEELKAKISSLKVAPIDVSINASSIDSSIKSIQSKFAAIVDPELNVLANTELAETKIKELLTDLSSLQDSEVFIRANDTQALGKIQEIKSELGSLLDRQIKLNVNTTEATNKLASLEKELLDLQSLSINPDITTTQLAVFEANIKRVKNEIASLKGEGVVIPITVPPIPPNAIRSINELENELKELQNRIDFSKDIQEIRKLGDEFKKLQTQINNLRVVGGLENKFDKIGASANNAAIGLKKVPGASDQATLALSNLSRVVQDAPFGFLGIANNLNPLLESFERLKKTSGTTGSALKAVAGSLLGAGGLGFAVSLVSSLLISFGGRLFSSGKNAAEAKNEITEFGEAVNDAGKSFADSAVKATSLVAALSGNSLTLKERKAALDELKSVNQQFFGSLKEEDGLIKGLQAAYDGYIQRIREVGKTKAIESQLTKLFDKKLQLELQIDPKFIANIDPATQRQIGAAKKELQSLGGAVDITKEKFNAFNQTQARRLALQQKITQLESGTNVKLIGDQFGFIESQVKALDLRISALSGLLKTDGKFDIKIPPPKKEDADKLIDETIALAKLAAKEFEAGFVVPELDITFFKNKDAVFKDAKQFLVDVKDFLQGNVGALKIKLPVTVSTETKLDPTDLKRFLRGEITRDQIKEIKIRVPVVTDFDIQLAQSLIKEFEPTKDLIDNFFKSVQLEREIPIEVTPDLTLSKASIDAINKKLDLQKQFSILGSLGDKEFGKIFENIDTNNFQQLNAGIAEATKRLQGMMDIANTLNQAIGGGLANAFNAVFDAVLEGKSVFKALGQAIKELVVGTIKAIAQMLILKAITNLIFPGGGAAAGGVGRIFGSGFAGGGFGGQANLGFGGIGSSAFQNALTVNVVGQISNDTIRLSNQRSTNSSGRYG